MLMIRARNVDHMLVEAFGEIRAQPLSREQRAAIDEIALAATALVELPPDTRRAAVAALVELAGRHRTCADPVFFVD